MSDRTRITCGRCGEDGHAGRVYEDGTLPCPAPAPTVEALQARVRELEAALAAALAEPTREDQEVAYGAYDRTDSDEPDMVAAAVRAFVRGRRGGGG